MNKLTYWMRKSGMLRTSSYSVKGDAEKLNKVNASDGGMIQSQKDIDEQYKESQNQSNNSAPQNNNLDKKGSSSKALFWIFLVSGGLIFFFMLILGVIFASFLFVVLWIWFLHSIWKKSGQGMLLVGQTIAVGIAFLTVAFIFTIIAMPEEESKQEGDKSVTKAEEINKKEAKVTEGAVGETEKEKVVKEVVKKDKISQFFADLQKETGINFGTESTATVVWTNGGAGLGLQDGKEIETTDASDKTFKTIKKYFEDNDGTHGTIGMVFKGGSNQEGYYFQDGEYKMLMCVLTNTKEIVTVSCGWGPGGNK